MRELTCWGIGVWLALSPAALAMHDPARLIIPGKAIGPVALGATLDQVTARIGQPDDVRAIDAAHALMQWRDRSLVVGFEQDSVVLVGTNSNQYATSTGLKVGVPGTKALELFPALYAPSVKGLFGLCDDLMGINFLTHPVDAAGAPLQDYVLPEGWLIDEINVYRSAEERVLERAEATQP